MTVTGERDASAKAPPAASPIKEFLTEPEMGRFLAAARRGRHGPRDHAMVLMAYRHALRVSELVDLRLKDLDLHNGRLFVRRRKGSLSTDHPIEGDELRAVRGWLRVRGKRVDAGLSYVFLSERGPMTRQAVNYLVAQIGQRAKLGFHVHPHMLRHSAGYHLASRSRDIRLLQVYLGHKNIAHTVRYTGVSPGDFEGLWR
jgi:type 1 fimbriae regulatory protein FimB